MIPNGTIELLERIIDLLDQRKDAQDGDYWFYQSEPPFDWLLQPLCFPPPKILKGCVTEETLCEWLGDLEEILTANWKFEEERLARLCEYGHFPRPERTRPTYPRSANPEIFENETEPGNETGYFRPPTLDELGSPIVYPDDPDSWASFGFVRRPELEDDWE